ncbi:MAG: hypothetical protein SFV51_21955 [Bryobacteraceae bacterium]|nr:hypothetical protein [Bryobacteraceae bacterium]
MPYPPVEEIERIAAMTDPAARNLRITRAYHELSLAVAGEIPGGANWCTFAAWASRQAGQSIRREDLVKALASRLQKDPGMARMLHVIAMGRTQVLGAIDSVLRDIEPFRQSSEAVARGNLKVFAEIAPQFARFLNGESDDAAAPLLREAFANYRQARLATPGSARSEWMLLANLQIGFHEQTRLQPEIKEALDAVAGEPGQLGHRFLTRLFPVQFSPGISTLACRLVGERIMKLARQIITDRMMVLELPGAMLRLGHDLVSSFPEDLSHIANPELAGLLRLIDPTPDSTRESGALDWAAFSERIHFIADLFRTHHHKQELFTEPA